MSTTTATYHIAYANGQPDVPVRDEDEAREILSDEYPDAAYGDDWENAGTGRERLLVWEDQDAADGPDGNGDGGEHAVAEIVRVRPQDWPYDD